MVSHPSSRRGFSRVDEQRPQPASTHPGRLPRQPSLGKGAEGGERKFPYGVEVRERGWAPRFLREAWGHQEQAVKESARLGAGFPDPRALRIPLVSKFPPSSASTGEPSYTQLSLPETLVAPERGTEPGEYREERMARESLRGPCSSRPLCALPGSHCGRGLHSPASPSEARPGSPAAPQAADPGHYRVQPPRGRAQAQEPGWRGAGVLRELEAAGKGLGPRRIASGQSRRDIFYWQMCGPRPSFYRLWGTEDQVVLLEAM